VLTCSVEVPGAGGVGVGAVVTPSDRPSERPSEGGGDGRGEEKESIYGIVSPVLSVTAKKESSVLSLGIREGVGKSEVFGAERRAAHQGWVRKWVRSGVEGDIVVVAVVVVAVVGGEGESDGSGGEEGEDGDADCSSDILSTDSRSRRVVG
jgi:hypothetical protein